MISYPTFIEYEKEPKKRDFLKLDGLVFDLDEERKKVYRGNISRVKYNVGNFFSSLNAAIFNGVPERKSDKEIKKLIKYEIGSINPDNLHINKERFSYGEVKSTQNGSRKEICQNQLSKYLACHKNLILLGENPKFHYFFYQYKRPKREEKRNYLVDMNHSEFHKYLCKNISSLHVVPLPNLLHLLEECHQYSSKMLVTPDGNFNEEGEGRYEVSYHGFKILSSQLKNIKGKSKIYTLESLFSSHEKRKVKLNSFPIISYAQSEKSWSEWNDIFLVDYDFILENLHLKDLFIEPEEEFDFDNIPF